MSDNSEDKLDEFIEDLLEDKLDEIRARRFYIVDCAMRRAAGKPPLTEEEYAVERQRIRELLAANSHNTISTETLLENYDDCFGEKEIERLRGSTASIVIIDESTDLPDDDYSHLKPAVLDFHDQEK